MRTYGKARLRTNFYSGSTPMARAWVIEDLEPHVCIKLKAVFPQIPKHRAGAFYVDDSPDRCKDLVWFFSRYPVEMPDEDRKLLEAGAARFDQTQAKLEEILKPDYTPRTFDLKKPLRPYQAQFVETFLSTKRILNGDDVGLGKTACAIGAWTDKSTLPAIVVVQTHLPTQWAEQIAKFSDLRVHIVRGTKPYSLPPADVYIMKYSCIAGWVDTFKQKLFKSAVFDEVQELRTGTSMKCQAAQELSRQVEYCLGLSATPIYNYGNEIYNVLDSIKPGCLGKWEDFSREWLGWGDKRVVDPKALGSYLRENFLMVRRTRDETAQYLDPVNRIVHTVDYDEEAVLSVQELAKKLATSVVSGTFIERGQAARELDIMMRHITGVSKAKYVAEYVKVLLENKESVLLVGWHRDVYDIWLRELADYKPVMYTGTESAVQKELAKRAFVSGESPLMILSLRSGVGMDGLQERGSIVVFGELDWSPQVHEQVIGRLRRDGQKNQVTAIYLVSESGSDPLIVDLLGLKSSQATGIMNPSATGVETVESDTTRIRMLAERLIYKKIDRKAEPEYIEVDGERIKI
jgi:SNF2 family DNA or RNA helicase